MGCWSTLETVINLTLQPGTWQEAAWTIKKLSIYVQVILQKNQFYLAVCTTCCSLNLQSTENMTFPKASSWVCPEKEKYSYINGMILSVSEFLPAGWARVGIPKGITEALTAEDMAAFGWHNQASALHNLEEKKPQPVCGVKNSALLVYWHQANRTCSIRNRYATTLVIRNPKIFQHRLGKCFSLCVHHWERTLSDKLVSPEIQGLYFKPAVCSVPHNPTELRSSPSAPFSLRQEKKRWQHADPYLGVAIHANRTANGTRRPGGRENKTRKNTHPLISPCIEGHRYLQRHVITRLHRLAMTHFIWRFLRSLNSLRFVAFDK